MTREELDALTPYEAKLLWREIFDTYYDVEAKQMYCYSDWTLEVAGIPMTGSDEWDMAMAEQYNVTKRTIGNLADWVADEIPFYIHRQSDSVYIFNMIKKYNGFMIALLDRANVGANRMRRNEDFQHIIEDCERLANLANHLFTTVQMTVGEEAYRIFGVLPDELVTEGRSGRTALRFGYQGNAGIKEDNKEIPRRVSITDGMSDRLRQATRLWRNTTED